MRYIGKGNEPQSMREWKQMQQEAGLPLAYRDFRDKQGLNAVLRFVQHGVCCYCQKCIDHFQQPKERGAHNEHLIPENGIHGVFAKQMDYDNLFACCIESQGMERKQTHCGEHKKENVIFPFIQVRDCQNFFRYNSLGEIIPNGKFSKWSDYLDNREELNGMVKEAVDAIDTLNLNCNALVSDRQTSFRVMMKWASGKDAKAIKHKMLDFESRHQFPDFIDMLQYFLQKRIDNLCGNNQK